MGHDITAYKLDKVSSLRYGMMENEKDKKEIYELLNSIECYNSVSGNGTIKRFEKQEIREALMKASDKNSNEVIQFLEDCYDNCNKNDYIMIEFS